MSQGKESRGSEGRERKEERKGREECGADGWETMGGVKKNLDLN